MGQELCCGCFYTEDVVVSPTVRCLPCGPAWLPFPWGGSNAQSLVRALSGLLKSLSLARPQAAKSQHSPGWWHCGLRVSGVRAVDICVLLSLAEECEGAQGPAAGGGAVALGDSSARGCLEGPCGAFPVPSVLVWLRGLWLL